MDMKLKAQIILGENLDVLKDIPDGSIDLIYIDPPFNTGKRQSRTQISTKRSEDGDRVGFKGERYKTIKIGTKGYNDQFDDFMEYIKPRLDEAFRVLKETGTLYFHIDYREVHYCKILLDGIFGRENFLNEIIWAYDFGGRSKRRWSAKHDMILWYTKHPKDYTFNFERMQRIPYMAPGLVGPEKARRGKTPTDVWWHTIVPTRSAERTGYPTQKPMGVLRRIVEVHTSPGDHLLDFFAGSGTAGEAASEAGCRFTLIDSQPEAVQVMARRLAFAEPECVNFEPEGQASDR
jgi:site-specific DNA-methyltransferase (adenine-specific)